MALGYTLQMTRSRAVPAVLLAAALVGLWLFSRGLDVGDTVGMFVCASVAGAALAAVARKR